MKNIFQKSSFQLGVGLFLGACQISAAQADVSSFHQFEEKDPSEETYISVLTQAFKGKAQATKLRGTHSKGVCVKSEFQLYGMDSRAIRNSAVKRRLRKGFLALEGTYPSRLRFANAEGSIRDDHAFDPRAISLIVDFGAGQRQDFILQNSPIFPIPTLQDFVLVVLQGNPEQAMALTKLSQEEMVSHLKHVRELVGTFPTSVNSYLTQTYWSGTAFALGDLDAVKYVATPCAQNALIAANPQGGPNFLQDDVKNHVNGAGGNMACFELGVQILNTSVMTDKAGMKRRESEWVENAGLEWKAQEAPIYPIAKITLKPNSVETAEECDDPKMAINVNENTFPENRAIGQINRGRRAPEAASAQARASAGGVNKK